VPVTPVGKLVIVAPVAPVVAYVILVSGVLMHTVCAFVPAGDVNETEFVGLTVTVTVKVAPAHAPDFGVTV
jgi:hypothetical protein